MAAPASAVPEVKFAYTSTCVTEGGRAGGEPDPKSCPCYPSRDTGFVVVSGVLAPGESKLALGDDVIVSCRCGSCKRNKHQAMRGTLVSTRMRQCNDAEKNLLTTAIIRQIFTCSYSSFGSWLQTEFIEVPLLCVTLYADRLKK